MRQSRLVIDDREAARNADVDASSTHGQSKALSGGAFFGAFQSMTRQSGGRNLHKVPSRRLEGPCVLLQRESVRLTCVCFVSYGALTLSWRRVVH